MNLFNLITLALLALIALLQLFLLLRAQRSQNNSAEHFIAAPLRELRQEFIQQAQSNRGEAQQSISQFQQSITQQMAQLAQLQNSQIDGFAQLLTRLMQSTEEKQQALREAVQNDARQNREETGNALRRANEAMQTQLTEVRTTLDTQLKNLQTDNAAKLEEMRRTVDEKLHATLEARLGESFKQVSERLEKVHQGLGEMQVLAAGVGDLKKVLTNVKSRGTWGEVQLGMLLEQILTREQYASNVATIPGSNERVEFAIRLPGQADSNTPVWLPIDAKFPHEDYERLVLAQERADLEGVEAASKQLETRIKLEAKTLREKYLAPPHTTDFAILFLPTEGLYAEIIRRPGLCDLLQRDFRITIAGPTTLTALLNSLQMGFRTLAIEQRSSEVWQLLGAVKTEFGKFGDVLAKTKKKLEEASNTIGDAEVRTRAIERKLRGVESLTDEQTQDVLGMSSVKPLGDEL